MRPCSCRAQRRALGPRARGVRRAPRHAAPVPADGDLARALDGLAAARRRRAPGRLAGADRGRALPGQSFELDVAADELAGRLRGRAALRPPQRDEPVELVNLRPQMRWGTALHAAHERRVTAIARTTSPSRWCSCASPGHADRSPRPELAEGPPRDDGVAGRRKIVVEGVQLRRVLDRRRLGAGKEVRGPAIVEFDGATCLVAPGWAGGIDAAGTLVLAREGARERRPPGRDTPWVGASTR